MSEEKRMIHVPTDYQELKVTDECKACIEKGYKPGDILTLLRVDYERTNSGKVRNIERKITVTSMENRREVIVPTDQILIIGDEEYEILRANWLYDNGKYGDNVGITIVEWYNITEMFIVPRIESRDFLTRLRLDRLYWFSDDEHIEEAIGKKGRTPERVDLAVDYCYTEYLDYSSNPTLVDIVEIATWPKLPELPLNV